MEKHVGSAWGMLPAAILVLAGCAAHYPTKECYSIDDCPSMRGDKAVCFLGTCQPQGYSVQLVHAELTPPASSDLLTQQTGAPLDLANGYQVISLLPSVTVQGTVVSADGTCSGTLIAKKNGTIPGHDIVRRAPVDSATFFNLSATVGSYTVSFVPYGATASSSGTSAPQPPVSFGPQTFAPGEQGLQVYHYPASADLVVKTGRVLYTSTPVLPVEGAFVSATAMDATGALVASTTDVTLNDGRYTLVFPPGAQFFTVSVRPDGTAHVPEITKQVAPDPSQPGWLQDLVLGAQQLVVNATVHDPSGAPVPFADVFFQGAGSSSDGTPWSYLAHLTADGLGAVSGATVFAGQYVVTVVPSKTAPVALSSTPTPLPAPDTGSTLTLTAGPKIHVSGHLVAHDGTAVTDTRITLTLRDAPSAREYTVQTDAGGAYTLDVDPGDYDVTVEPPVGSIQPRYRMLAKLSSAEEVLDIQLYRPTFAFGQVVDPYGAPAGGVMISFYSSELSTGPTPLLVGVGVTAPNGEFVVPLPRPNDI